MRLCFLDYTIEDIYVNFGLVPAIGSQVRFEFDDPMLNETYVVAWVEWVVKNRLEGETQIGLRKPIL